ncbi:MAG: PIG-L family deacetylase [Candidatus Omnitrophica bacterium]|nr:PIG-L family deacetylase [Candidatus Omnitrophota bacterium]
MIKRLLKPAYIAFKQQMLKFRLAFTPVKEHAGQEPLLVIAPHPDDEILGVGGYMLRRIKGGSRVYVVFLTDGAHSLPDLDPDMVAEERVRISNGVLFEAGVPAEDVFRLHLPDGRLPRKGGQGFAEAASVLSGLITSLGPQAVFVTHLLETWPYDHVAAFELAEAATADMNGISLFGYWVWLSYSLPIKQYGGIDWSCTSRIPLGMEMKAKKKLMKAYLSPAAMNGKPWSGNLPRSMLKIFSYPYEVVTFFQRG